MQKGFRSTTSCHEVLNRETGTIQRLQKLTSTYKYGYIQQFIWLKSIDTYFYPGIKVHFSI